MVNKPNGGGSAKSTASLPTLDNSITETAYQAWLFRFDRYCISHKLTDDEIKNRIFEAVPTVLADQICVDIEGNESKVKCAVVKKRSVFL